MDIMFAVNLIHAPGVEKYQHYEDINRALLGEPKAELEAADTNGIELLDQKNTEAEGNSEPDDEAQSDESKIGTPVSQAFVLVHDCPGYCYGGSM
jgi:hypothetical protein